MRRFNRNWHAASCNNLPCNTGFFQSIQPNKAYRSITNTFADLAQYFFAGSDFSATDHTESIEEADAKRAGSGRAAMFHPTHDFLADVTPLLEIHCTELVEVGFVREGVDCQVIASPFGNAERNPARMVGGRFCLREVRCGSLDGRCGPVKALAERGMPRVVEGVELLAGDRGRIQADSNRGLGWQQVNRHRRPEPVLRELAGEFFRESAGDIDQEERFVVAGVEDEHVGDDLALRGQKRREPARAGGQPRDIRRQEIAEEMAGVRAGNGDEGTLLQPDRSRRGGRVRGG